MSLPLTYHPPMLRSSCSRLLLGAILLAHPACKPDSSDSDTAASDPGTGTTAPTSGPSTTPTSTDPGTGSSSTTLEPTSTTGEPTTGEPTTTGGPPPVLCSAITDEILCKNTEPCKWGGVVSYAYGNQGCQGNVTPFCVDKAPAGAASAWYREQDGDVQVLEFAYSPALAPEWKQCDCDGPLACLCTSVTAECPERMEAYCGFISTELGCGNVTFMGKNICDWFLVSPEGAKDDMCAQNPGKYRCLPAIDAGKNTCTKAKLPPYFGVCNPEAEVDPVFWREANDIIEVIQTCGPTPIGFTQCEPVDTPEQPDECGCQCK